MVVGHSVGEVAAAYAAGIFTAGQAISCAYHLGLAMLEMKGTMLHTEMQRKCLPTEARDATSVLPCCQLQPFFLFFFFVSSSNGLQPDNDGLQPNSDGLQPDSNGLQPNSKGYYTFGPFLVSLFLIAMASPLTY